jgi:hypothetical protein
MKLQNNTVTYSPSDLITFVKSPFASWMDRQYLEDLKSLTPDEDDPMLTVLARRGNEHEHQYLASLRTQDLDVCEINSSDENAQAKTLEAIDQGREVIFQARCKVTPGDTPDSLAAKIHELEYEHFPQVIERLLNE